MKTRLIIICLSSIIAVSVPAFAEVQHSADNVQPPEVEAITPATRSEILTSILASPSAMPRGPYDRLRDYEDGMAAIAQQFSFKLQAIVQGVQSGKLSREQGEQFTGEQYQIARMQFELLSALHQMLQQDLARATVVRYEPSPSAELIPGFTTAIWRRPHPKVARGASSAFLRCGCPTCILSAATPSQRASSSSA